MLLCSNYISRFAPSCILEQAYIQYERYAAVSRQFHVSLHFIIDWRVEKLLTGLLQSIVQ